MFEAVLVVLDGRAVSERIVGWCDQDSVVGLLTANDLLRALDRLTRPGDPTDARPAAHPRGTQGVAA